MTYENHSGYKMEDALEADKTRDRLPGGQHPDKRWGVLSWGAVLNTERGEWAADREDGGWMAELRAVGIIKSNSGKELYWIKLLQWKRWGRQGFKN